MRSLFLWGRSIQEMGVDVVVDRSIYGVVVIDGSLYSRFYGMLHHSSIFYQLAQARLHNVLHFLVRFLQLKPVLRTLLLMLCTYSNTDSNKVMIFSFVLK